MTKPIPVWERLPEEKDCNETHEIWVWHAKLEAWILYVYFGFGPLPPECPYWLPYYDLPAPFENVPALIDESDPIIAAGRVFQEISDYIVEAFQAAQIDPQQAAKIQEIAAALKAIRDRPR
jgi:hypothetical protein